MDANGQNERPELYVVIDNAIAETERQAAEFKAEHEVDNWELYDSEAAERDGYFIGTLATLKAVALFLDCGSPALFGGIVDWSALALNGVK